MTFHLNVQFAGTLLRTTPKAILVQPSAGLKCWLPRKAVIAFTRQDTLPVWRIPMAPYWFTVHRWIAAKKGLIDGRPESERM